MKEEAGVIVAPNVRDLAQLGLQLADWLSERMAGATDIRVVDLAYPFGAGQSHETILFDAIWKEQARECRHGMVVRIKPTDFRVCQDDMFVEQYRIMQVMHASGKIPVAEPLWFEEDPALLGAPFFVMRKVTGRVAVSVPSYMETGWVVEASPAQRATLWENGVRQLAAIQSVPVSAVPFLAVPGFESGFAQEWDRWRRYLVDVAAERSLPVHAAAWRRLERTLPKNRPQGIVWGDARLGNMIVGDDFDILAVMDWELPSLGGALQDLGWWLFSDRIKALARGGVLQGFGERADTIALWRDVTDLPTDDVDWYEAFAGFKIMCLSVRMMDLRGQTPPNGDYGNDEIATQVLALLDGIERVE